MESNPVFGVAVRSDVPSEVAHVYAASEGVESACGVSLRRMVHAWETELPTCPSCAEVARGWATGG